MIALTGWHILKFPGKISLFWLRRWKLKSAHPVNYFPGFFGKNIKNCPPAQPVNYSYLPPFTEKPGWIIWLIWAIVGQYTDKMTQKCVKNESFVRVVTQYTALMSQMIHSGFSVNLDHMLVQVEQNRMVQTIQNCVLTKNGYISNFWQKCWRHLEDVSVTERIVWC